MAVLHPFRAVRPVPEHAGEIACVPYDVISAAEARSLAAGNSLSFLHVVRPEIDLPPGIDEYDDAVYARGAENLRRYVDGPLSKQEEVPSIYVYRIEMGGRKQTGIFGCVSVADYDGAVILRHENTRLEKEDDRTRHIMAQGAHAEPVMLTFRDHSGVSDVIDATLESSPLYDLTTPDGIRHTIWRIDRPERLVELFEEIDYLYVADGHHRCKAASRTAEAEAGSNGVSDEVRYFPAVLFPMCAMNIMAYNRIIRKLPVSPERFLGTLKETFTVAHDAAPVPGIQGEISVFLDGSWYGIKLPRTAGTSVADRLDVSRLTEFLLDPLLGISDPRRDPNIDFVGGIRGIIELERLVLEGEADMAISMYPTSIQELVKVSDAGMLMPPKSTWFEPKLRSGLLVHLYR